MMRKGIVRKSKLVAAMVMAALAFDPVTIAPVEAAPTTPSSGGSFLYTPCAENVSQVTPLSARPLTPRKTLASPLPHRPRRHRRPAAHRRHVVRRPVVHAKAVAHRRPVARKHTVAHRPRTAAGRPLFRKVTYASPLCYDRAPMIAALLGDVPAPLFQPLALAEGPVPVVVSQIPQSLVNPPPSILEPVVPPVVIVPPNTPIIFNPPPTEVIPVPEPASWAMMIAGFGMSGWSLRRRRRREKGIAA